MVLVDGQFGVLCPPDDMVCERYVTHKNNPFLLFFITWWGSGYCVCILFFFVSGAAFQADVGGGVGAALG